MKTGFTAFLVIAFATIAVFGAFGMMHMTRHDMGCLAATAHDAACPEAGPSASVAFHFDILRLFLTAAFTLAALALFAGLFLRLDFGKLFDSPGSAIIWRRREDNFAVPPMQSIHGWLALHEKRDIAARLA